MFGASETTANAGHCLVVTTTDGGWRNEGGSYASSCSALWTAGTGTSPARDQFDRLIIGTAALHTGIGSHHLGRNVICRRSIKETRRTKHQPATYELVHGIGNGSRYRGRRDAMQRPVKDNNAKTALRTPSNEPCYKCIYNGPLLFRCLHGWFSAAVSPANPTHSAQDVFGKMTGGGRGRGAPPMWVLSYSCLLHVWSMYRDHAHRCGNLL